MGCRRRAVLALQNYFSTKVPVAHDHLRIEAATAVHKDALGLKGAPDEFPPLMNGMTGHSVTNQPWPTSTMSSEFPTHDSLSNSPSTFTGKLSFGKVGCEKVITRKAWPGDGRLTHTMLNLWEWTRYCQKRDERRGVPWPGMSACQARNQLPYDEARTHGSDEHNVQGVWWTDKWDSVRKKLAQYGSHPLEYELGGELIRSLNKSFEKSVEYLFGALQVAVDKATAEGERINNQATAQIVPAAASAAEQTAGRTTATGTIWAVA